LVGKLPVRDVQSIPNTEPLFICCSHPAKAKTSVAILISDNGERRTERNKYRNEDRDKERKKKKKGRRRRKNEC
jgi:hypothetical protein